VLKEGARTALMLKPRHVVSCSFSTGSFMSVTYEHPTSAAANALIIARALAAPLLATYLAMSRVLPITSKDILAVAELSSGRGLLKDITAAARDPEAPLDRKMLLYRSAALLTPSDKSRLDGMISAVMSPSTGQSFRPPLAGLCWLVYGAAGGSAVHPVASRCKHNSAGSLIAARIGRDCPK
jgi:hypothetical protein